MQSGQLQRIRELASGVCQREGVLLYDAIFVTGSHGQGRKLLVFIDKDGGVGVEDCEKVSRGLSLLLDVDDLIPGEYLLEVSSPGLDRHLREAWHFEKAVGSDISIESDQDLNQLLNLNQTVKRFKAKGKLLSVNDGKIEMELDSKTINVPIGVIKKSKVIHDFGGKNGGR